MRAKTRRAPKERASADQLLKNMSDSSTLAVNAAVKHAAAIEALAKDSKEYYELVSKLIAGVAAMLLFLPGFLGFTERKQRAELDKEIREQLQRAENAKNKMAELEARLQTHIETADSKLTEIKQQEIKANLWILDVNRATVALVFSTVFIKDPQAEKHYLKVAREILERVADDKTIADACLWLPAPCHNI
jgi:hypothetical protein